MRHVFPHGPLQILAVLLYVVSTSAVAEEPLGRLFLTQEKRDLLDRQRALNSLENQASEEPLIQINGQVRRSSGKRTTWINGQAQNDNETRTGIVALPDGRGTERIVIESRENSQTSVKIGETLNRSTQEAASPLGDGKVVVHKRGATEARP